MAGSTWPPLTAGKKAKGSDVEAKFDWIEGSIVPMNAGSTTTGVYDLGQTTAHWNNAYINTIACTITVNDIITTHIALTEQADIGSGATGAAILGAQTVDGKPELVFTDEDDNDIRITRAGGIDALQDSHRQDNTTDSTVSAQIVRKGWGTVQGDSTTAMNDSVSFGITFDSTPIVLVSFLSWCNSVPSSIGSFNDVIPTNAITTKVWLITTTGFTINIKREATHFVTTEHYGYSWIAIGTKT